MAELKVGYIYKKRTITYKNEKKEVYKLLDWGSGIHYLNTEGDYKYNLTLKYNENDQSFKINKSELENCLVFDESDLEETIKDNNNFVDFSNIRKLKLNNKSTYYCKDSKNNLVPITDTDLLMEAEKALSHDQETESFDKMGPITSLLIELNKSFPFQTEQIKQLLTSLYKNQKIVNSDLDDISIMKIKESILINGIYEPGIIEVLDAISRIINTPITYLDFYQEKDQEDPDKLIKKTLKKLYIEANQQQDLAEKGIIIINNIQDVIESESKYIVVNKLLAGEPEYLDNITFNTNRIMIIGLEQYSNKNTFRDNYIEKLNNRFSKIIKMNALTEEEIITYLKKSDLSPLQVSKEFLNTLGVKLEYNDDFLKYIINKNKTDNRGSLTNTFNEIMQDALFQLLDRNYSTLSLSAPTEGKTYILK